MKYTTNYNLKKPDDNDNVLISDLNGNADAVDAALHALAEGLNGAQGSLASAPEKQSLADGDGVVVTDSAAGNSAKRVLWSTVKTVLAQLFAPLTHKHAAGDVTSGTFAAARIPGLDAGKITSGILPVARGGTGVSSLAALAANLGVSSVVTGTYVGNGTYGLNKKTALTFAAPPKLVIVWGNDENRGLMPDGYGWRNSFLWAYNQDISYTTNSSANVFYTLSGNTLSWYSDSDWQQLNTLGKTYNYFALIAK